jgi:hypothetical protein
MPNLRPQLHKGVEGLFLLSKYIQSKNPKQENEREESG